MPVNRRQLPPAARRFFTQADRWTFRHATLANPWAAIGAAELAGKVAQHPELLTKTLSNLATPLDLTANWDQRHFPTFDRISQACLVQQFTGDPRALGWALEGLHSLAACDRPHFTYSSCLGVLDIDLRTAHAMEALATMRWTFGPRLDAAALALMKSLAHERILRPGLHAMRTKQYAWMRSKANWRIIICSMMGLGGLTFADDCDDARELLDYALEGVLVGLSTGDRTGGWNEGPGYWEYGLGFAVRFAWYLRHLSGGQVDLFQHPFLRRTGDFRLYMRTHGTQVWNWSDGGKDIGRSSTLAVLARVYRQPAYQRLLAEEGLVSLSQLYYFDPSLSQQLSPGALPGVKHFPGCGVLVARTGFGEQDTFVGVKAADIPHYNHHCHLDGGSVVIHAAGRELLAENEHWAYPREGRKDPSAKPPSRPGLWDEELKRWKRWDLDSVGAHGHNSVVIEGSYPRPRLHQPRRLRLLASTPDYDLISVDSSAYYQPVASLVRRTVLFLRPDIVLLCDELRAPTPVRARVQFHFLGEATITGTEFSLVNGPAQLLGRCLSPTRDDNLIIGAEDRRTLYEQPAGIVEKRNRYLYLENLWRQKRLVFLTALQVGASPLVPATFTLTGQPQRDRTWSLTVTRGAQVTLIQRSPRGWLVTPG